MRKALCIGIDFYTSGNHLNGCVNDAVAMQEALEFHEDESRNFETRLLAAYNEDTAIDDVSLASYIDWLFEGSPDIALLYFSGHGSFTGAEGYLCPSNFGGKYTGVSMSNLIKAAADSKARNKVIILDCCHSGAAGNTYFSRSISELPEDTVILAGCSQDGYSMESEGQGVFTGLFIEALSGAGSNILGEVSPGSIYAYIDKSLGAFEQRPVFKANVKSFISLKKNKPLVSLKELRLLTKYFKYPNYKYSLDPTYEEDKHHTENKDVNKAHEEIFATLRKFEKLGLITPVDEEYMYWAAIHSTGCKLTAQGKHYWQMIHKGLI